MIITTTGTQATVVIGVGDHQITLTHPETYDLLGDNSVWDSDDLETYRGEVNTALSAGTITATTQSGDPVTTVPSQSPGGVTSVNGQSGTAVLDTDDVSEGSNLYHTNGRVAAAPAVIANAAAAVANAASAANALNRANHTGTQPASSVTGLSDVATSGSFVDLDDLPNLGTAAAANTGDFATASQGAIADTAVQPGDDAVFDSITVGSASDPNCALLIEDDTGADICYRQVGTNGSAFMRLEKALGTIASPAALTQGEKIGGYSGAPHDGTAFVDTAEVAYYVTEDHDATNKGTEIRMSVTNEGSATRVDALTLRDDGTKDFHSTRGVNAADPVGAQDIATKAYVDTRPYIITGSGRVYGYTDNRWVYPSSAYAYNYYQWNSNAGTATDPAVHWYAQGELLPAGTTVRRILVKGRSNNTQITGLSMFLRAHEADFKNPTEGDFDSVAEVNAVTVQGPTNIFPAYAQGNSADMRMGEVLVNGYDKVTKTGGYVLQNDTDLLIYWMPLGTLTGTRYYYVNYMIEVALP